MTLERLPANDNGAPRLIAGERRRRARERVLLGGKLAYLTSSVTADCTVRNLSEDGALLVLPDLPLPQDPFLIVTSRATAHRACTVWRDNGRAGVAFQASWPFDAATPSALAGLRDLWLELLPRSESDAR